MTDLFQGVSWASKAPDLFRTTVSEAYVKVLLCVMILSLLPFIMDRNRLLLFKWCCKCLISSSTIYLLPPTTTNRYHSN